MPLYNHMQMQVQGRALLGAMNVNAHSRTDVIASAWQLVQLAQRLKRVNRGKVQAWPAAAQGTCRMLARPCSSGSGTSTLLDSRPGRVSAASSTCAVFLA